MCQQLACLRWWKVTRVTFIWLVFPLTLTAIVFLIFLFATYQAHRLLTSGLKAHKVVHASLGSRFGQQDLYFPILIEILMIYFFQYGSFGGSVCYIHHHHHCWNHYQLLDQGVRMTYTKWENSIIFICHIRQEWQILDFQQKNEVQLSTNFDDEILFCEYSSLWACFTLLFFLSVS